MGVYSYGLKGLKAGATKLAQKLSGQGKTTGKEGIKFFKHYFFPPPFLKICVPFIP